MTHTLRDAISDARDDHPAIAMTDEDHLTQILYTTASWRFR